MFNNRYKLYWILFIINVILIFALPFSFFKYILAVEPISACIQAIAWGSAVIMAYIFYDEIKH